MIFLPLPSHASHGLFAVKVYALNTAGSGFRSRAREILRVRDKPNPDPGEDGGEEGSEDPDEALRGLAFGQGCEKLILCDGWVAVQVNLSVMSRHIVGSCVSHYGGVLGLIW